MTQEEIIEMAREAGFDPHDMSSDFTCNLENINAFAKLIAEKAIKEALAQLEQEPVGSLSVRYHRGCKSMTNTDFDYNGDLPEGDYELYTTPPQRTWVGLTQTQVKLLWEGVQEQAVKSGDSLNWVFYTHINEALKEKNT